MNRQTKELRFHESYRDRSLHVRFSPTVTRVSDLSRISPSSLNRAARPCLSSPEQKSKLQHPQPLSDTASKPKLAGDRFPWGTLFVNVLGCFLLGWLARTAADSDAISDSMKLTIGTGFLGAFTTFSTFGVQTVQLWSRSPIAAFGNVASNLLVGIAAVAVGMYLAAPASSAN